MPSPPPVFQRLELEGRRFTLELWANPGAGSVLFYPGTMLSPRQYRLLMRALHRAGLAVAGLHLEGHGVNPHKGCFTFDALLEDGLYAERWLHEAGLGPVAVIGHSQGGILATAHAGRSRTLTAAFAICTILPQMPEAIGLTRFARFAARRDRLESAIAVLGRVLPRIPLTVSCYLSVRRILAGHGDLRLDRRGGRMSYPLGFLASLFKARVSPVLHCPFRLYNARNDALFTPELARAVFSKMSSPEKSLVWLSGGGHLAPMAPHYATFIARDAAAVCAGLGMPLRLDVT